MAGTRDYLQGRRDREADDAAAAAGAAAQPSRPVARRVPAPKPRAEQVGIGEFVLGAVVLPVLVALTAGAVAWFLDADSTRVALIAATITLGLIVVVALVNGTPEMQWLIVLALAAWLLLAWIGVVSWLPPHPW